MEFPTVAIVAPVLPAPLPRLQQDLMNLFHGHWRTLALQVRANNQALSPTCCEIFVNPSIPGMMRSPTFEEVAAVFPRHVVAACILGHLNYQVENGGMMQWNDNGHSTAVQDLIVLYREAATLGVGHAGTAAVILEDFVRRKAEDEAPRDTILCTGDDGMPCDIEDESFDDFGDLTTRYYALPGVALMQAVLDAVFPDGGDQLRLAA